MLYDVWRPMITSDQGLRNKSLRGRNKFAHFELLRGLARPVPRYAVTVTYRNQQRGKKNFLSSEKKSKAKSKKYNDDFQKVVISDQIPDALRDLHASKYQRLCNKPNNGCLCKPAKRNSDLLRSLKHLKETRLYARLFEHFYKLLDASRCMNGHQ